MTYWCTRCGAAAYSEYCDRCEADYQQSQRDLYESGEPYPVVVGRAYGGEVAIWVHEQPEYCGCRGSGWHSTELDSWHQCPHHFKHQPHPEYL